MSTDPWVSGLSGQTLNGYRIGDYLGGGNFGRVFEAESILTGSKCAIKVLVPTNDPEAAAQFESEGVLLHKLSGCGSVINCIDSGTASLEVNFNGAAVQLPMSFHVLTLASGVLEELTDDPVLRSAIPWDERLSHWRGAVKGVHQMHLNKVAHRDLKASNCLLMLRGGSTEVRLADLGRSRDWSDVATQTPQVYLQGRGDRRYAPPEFLWLQGGSSAADFRSADLYGLGSLLVELATGHPMTALAFGPWQDAIMQGCSDFQRGYRRDLATLRPQLHKAIEDMAGEFAPAIRADTCRLLRQICDPVPTARHPKIRLARPQGTDAGLHWLLERIDVMSRCLSIRDRSSHHKNKNRSAS